MKFSAGHAGAHAEIRRLSQDDGAPAPSPEVNPRAPNTPEGEQKRGLIGRAGSCQELGDALQVPQGVYLKWIKDQLEGESACLELPLTIILLVSFSFLAIMHLKQDIVFSVEQGIERDIIDNANFAFSHYFGHKDIFDAHSIPDFWSWIRLGFIPLAVQPTWFYSEKYPEDAQQLFGASVSPRDLHRFGSNPLPLPIRGDYLHYHRIIGGLRFRQEAVPMTEGSCKFPSQAVREEWMRWYGKPCMPATFEMPFTPDSVTAEGFGESSRIEWMFTDIDSLDTMLAQAVDMEDGCSQMAAKNRSTCLCQWCQQFQLPWLTENTQRVEIQMATYNAEYGLISLTGVNFFFDRGGTISKRVEIKSSWLDLFAMPWSELVPMLLCDTIWLTSLIYITVNELREIVHTARYGEGRWYSTLWNDYLAFWNIVDWISIVVAIVVVGFFAQLMVTTSHLHSAFADIIEASPRAQDLGRDAYSAVVIQFYSSLEEVTYWERTWRMSLCVYPMMVMLRLFKSFAAQPRLAMVTETMQEAYQDMVHFSLVFTGVTVCLCLNAVLLFGQDHQEFATLARSLHSCFRMMFGDWDWKPMEEVWRFTAMLWFWLFMTLLVVILLNMLLAIILDNYMKVKKKSSHAITLGGQIQSMWRRYKQNQRRERVKLNEVLDWFRQDAGGSDKQMMASQRKIRPSFLIENIRGMKEEQALRTLRNALGEHEKATEPEFMLEDVVDPLDRIDEHTRMSRDGLFYSYDRVDFYDTGCGDEQEPGEEPEVFVAGGRLLTPGSQQISDEVLEFVHSEVQRLSSETARVLAQSTKRVDQRQKRIEQRQGDMDASVRDMHASLLNLQSEASSLAHRLQRLCFVQSQHEATVASAWRRGVTGCKAMPGCFDFTSAAVEASEGSLPMLKQRSGFSKSLPAG